MSFDADTFIPFLVFSIPIIAIVGGITLGIVKTLGRQRLIELAQQERIAAIQRGVDVSKLPPPPNMSLDDDDLSLYLPGPERDRRRAQGLMVGGIITLAVGIGLMGFLSIIEQHDNVWAVGIIPASVGLALLLSAWLVRPKDGGTSAGPPRAN